MAFGALARKKPQILTHDEFWRTILGTTEHWTPMHLPSSIATDIFSLACSDLFSAEFTTTAEIYIVIYIHQLSDPTHLRTARYRLLDIRDESDPQPEIAWLVVC